MIQEGDWERAIKLLGDLGIYNDDTRREATFFIYQQKFLEVSQCNMMFKQLGNCDSNSGTHFYATYVTHTVLTACLDLGK